MRDKERREERIIEDRREREVFIEIVREVVEIEEVIKK